MHWYQVKVTEMLIKQSTNHTLPVSAHSMSTLFSQICTQVLWGKYGDAGAATGKLWVKMGISKC